MRSPLSLPTSRGTPHSTVPPHLVRSRPLPGLIEVHEPPPELGEAQAEVKREVDARDLRTRHLPLPPIPTTTPIPFPRVEAWVAAAESHQERAAMEQGGDARGSGEVGGESRRWSLGTGEAGLGLILVSLSRMLRG